MLNLNHKALNYSLKNWKNKIRCLVKNQIFMFTLNMPLAPAYRHSVLQRQWNHLHQRNGACGGFLLKKKTKFELVQFFFVECITLNFYSLRVSSFKSLHFRFLIDYLYLVKKAVTKLNRTYSFYVVIVEVRVVKEFERL